MLPDPSQENQLPFDSFKGKENQAQNINEQASELIFLGKEVQPNSRSLEQPSNSTIVGDLFEQHLAVCQENNTKNSKTSDTNKAVLGFEERETDLINKTLETARVKVDSSTDSVPNSKDSDNEYGLPDFFQTAWNRMELALKQDLLTSKTTWSNVNNSALNFARQELAKSVRCYIDKRLKELANIQEQTIKARIDAEAEVKATEKLRRKIDYILAEEKRLEQVEREQEQAERRDKQIRDRWKYRFYIARRSRNIIAFLVFWGAICFYWGGVALINTPKIVVCDNRSSPCYYLRYWGMKYTVADLNKYKNPKPTKCKIGRCKISK